MADQSRVYTNYIHTFHAFAGVPKTIKISLTESDCYDLSSTTTYAGTNFIIQNGEGKIIVTRSGTILDRATRTLQYTLTAEDNSEVGSWKAYITLITNTGEISLRASSLGYNIIK